MALKIQFKEELGESDSDDDESDEDVLDNLPNHHDHYYCFMVMGTRASKNKVETTKGS